jgi:hypothetical protein
VEPAAAFGLQYGVNAIAMPMIGGTTSWAGPLVGAILLGTLQQIATVTISSVMNLLIVGAMLVAFVIAAPVGIVGMIREFLQTAAPARLNWRAGLVIAVASYCFVVGMLAIIFSMPVLQTAFQPQLPWLEIARSGAAWLGVTGMIVGALYIVSAYGLLKLQRWAPPLTAFALIASVAWNAALIGADSSQQRLALSSTMIAIALAALLLLLNRKVRLLYNAPPGMRPGGDPVPA